MKINYPSISQFAQLVELKDYRPATKKEYVRNVRKLAEHFQCDPATLCEKPGPPPEGHQRRGGAGQTARTIRTAGNLPHATGPAAPNVK